MLAGLPILRTTSLALAAAVLVAAAPPPARANADAGAMIEALQPGATRNLVVRQTTAAPDAARSGGAAAGIATAAPSLTLAIAFEPNSAQVRPESGPLLGNLVAAMLSPELRTRRFVIEGHTDGRGAPAANQRLSQLRAEEVRLYLMALGVSPARLKAVGKGAAEPANPLDPLAPENRRVRVVTIE